MTESIDNQYRAYANQLSNYIDELENYQDKLDNYGEQLQMNFDSYLTNHSSSAGKQYCKEYQKSINYS